MASRKARRNRVENSNSNSWGVSVVCKVVNCNVNTTKKRSKSLQVLYRTVMYSTEYSTGVLYFHLPPSCFRKIRVKDGGLFCQN